MTKLTTHILDTSNGIPAKGVRIELYRHGCEDGGRSLVTSAVTNSDGRVETPLLEGTAFQVGAYELAFRVGDYFEGKGAILPDPKFLDVVIVRFGIADQTSHYHVPLLVSPYGYSTYRGS